MYLLKDKRGYYRLFDTSDGKTHYLKYLGKDPKPYLDTLDKGNEILEALKEYPDLALKGGQAALAEYKRRKMPRIKSNGKQYQTIVIDPPWPMEKITRDVRPNQFDFDYPVMSIEEIKNFKLPVNPEGCHVYLWTTQKFLPIAFSVFESWGIKYECLLTWVKNVGFTPFSFMYSTEHCLFGRCGSLSLLKLGKRLDIAAKVRQHSRKPAEFYDLVREVSPEPRVDIFSREPHEGFDQYGNETAKFTEG